MAAGGGGVAAAQGAKVRRRARNAGSGGSGANGGVNPEGGGGGKGSSSSSSSSNEEHVRRLLLQNPVPLDKLREVALSRGGGFVSNELRQLVWPKLLGLNRFEAKPYRHFVARNRWSDQIARDVDRSLWHYHLPHAKKRKRGNRRRLLAEMINAVMVKHPSLHYYQGYHDVLSVLVLTLTDDEDLCFAVAERVSLAFLGDYMLRPDFQVLTLLLELLFPLVTTFDPELGRFLDGCGLHAYVCLPWVITWWAHDCHDLGTVARLYDAFLAAPTPLFPLYLAVAMVVAARGELLALEDGRDFATVHSFVARLASRDDLPVEDLIVEAHRMVRKRPPQALIKAVGSPVLLRLAREGGIHALRYPPEWHSRWAEPDWLLLDARRRQEGRHARGKLARHRRRRAFLAGAAMPADEKRRGGRGLGMAPASIATTAIVGVAAVLSVTALLLNRFGAELPYTW